MNFDTAIARVASFGPHITVSDEDKLSLYGLFKQARNGDANDKDAPSRFQFVQSTKFRAWRDLKGLSREQAEQKYIDLVARLDPAWAEEMKDKAPPAPPTQNRTVRVVTPEEEALEQKQRDEEKEQQGYKPARRQSLDRNFVFSLRPTASPTRLSNTLEKVLNNNSSMVQENGTPGIKTRPRARSLDLESSFVVAPWAPIEAVGETVKKLVLKEEDTRSHRRGRVVDHLEGVGNVRDFGGLPALTADGKPGRIRRNVLLRCAQFNEATQKDAEFFLREFGLRTIVDFRSADCVLAGHLSPHFLSVELRHAEQVHLVHSARETAERLRISLPLITRPLVQAIIRENAPAWRKIQMLFLVMLERMIGFFRRFFAALPLLEVISNRVLTPLEKILAMMITRVSRQLFVDAGLRSLYTHMLLDGHKELKPAIELVTESTMHPAAFHCSFGKDRTGIVAALVLHAAGVSREQMLQDFEMSHHFVDTARGQREWEHSIKEMPELAHFKEEWARSPAASLEYALKQVEKRFGSMDAYFKQVLGLDEQWIKKVRSVLVEPIEEEGSTHGEETKQRN